MVNQNQWCFSWFASRPTARGAERAALVKGSKWKSGDMISVSFLDGDTVVKDKVREMAERWTQPGLANLTLDFRDDVDTLVRISFRYRGSWSVLGTSCRQVPGDQPTMNYGCPVGRITASAKSSFKIAVWLAYFTIVALGQAELTKCVTESGTR